MRCIIRQNDNHDKLPRFRVVRQFEAWTVQETTACLVSIRDLCFSAQLSESLPVIVCGMSQDTYRITSPTMSLFFEGDLHISRALPKGALVTIASETFNGNRLVEVLYEGKVVMMFTQDLRSRAEKVEHPKTST